MDEDQLQEIFNAENDGENLTIKQTYDALCICGKDPVPTELALFFENEGVGIYEDEQCVFFFACVEAQADLDPRWFQMPLESRRQRLYITESEGTIEFEQFRRLYDTISELSEEELAEAFKVFDRNENGTIDKEELKEILQRRSEAGSDFTDDLDDETIDKIFNAVDNFGDEDREGISDGCVSYKELARYLMANKTLGLTPSEEAPPEEEQE